MTKLLRALLVFCTFQRFSAESLASAECQLGTITLEQSSLVQRNHTSTKVMLVSDAVIRSDRSRLFSEAFLASCGKHMVLALSGAFPEQGSFPLEVFLPVGLLLAMLGCFLVTRDDKDAKNETKSGAKSDVAKSDVAKSSVRDGAPMFAPSEPKARQGRPHEFQASAKSQGPQPTLINICPNLVVPEKVECTILVPQVSSLKSSRVIPLCDLSGGTILQLEVVRHHRSEETRLLLFSPSREIQFASCQMATLQGSRGFSLHGQDASRQALLRPVEGGCLLTAQQRRSIRFRISSPGSINASDDDGQLLAYSDPASADAQGLPRLTLKVGPQVDAGLMALCYVAMGLLDERSKTGC